ncbi:MFS transporter [Compostimonas suwonensis]|uniref:MFS transporter n=1 Tax=Compostimonas suwonensis TaxID=1048394 RepID=A0A2M9BWQ2_9MICO|nr:MFS transporter [Compostimonas suwonensis]PJJ62383.1 MFS transporter [Compostimonas suwonensis]
MSENERGFSFRSIALPALLPTLLFSIGEGTIIPIIPAVASNLGASLALAGFIAAMIMLGELAGDIPSGWVVSRIGERTAMIWAALLSIVAVVVCIAAPNPWVFAIGIFFIGISTAVFGLARHAFMTSFVPEHFRARALSTLGGVFRAGWFIGPFVAAGIIHLTGSTQSVFWVMVTSCLGCAVILLVLPDPAATFGKPRMVADRAGELRTEGEELAAEESEGLFQTIRTYGGVLVRMGSAVAVVAALRSARTVMMPLWAVSIGINEANTALIVGIAAAVDFGLFYTSGQIMDRWGRMWSAIPSLAGMSLGFFVLSLSHDLPDSVTWFIVIAIVLAAANGIGSGLVMTSGADLAPKGDPAPFLGAWRFIGDAGGAIAPLAISTITALASIALASSVVGAVGIVGIALFARYGPRYLPRKPRPAR